VHAVACIGIATNYAFYRRTGNDEFATHIILLIGTVVVTSLFATGGWDQSGYLWPFAYLPYAFFLSRPVVARTWVILLFVACVGVTAAASLGYLDLPYSPVQVINFFAALAVFSLCMFLLQHAVVKYEQLAHARADELAAKKVAEVETAKRVEHLQEMNRFRSQFLNTAAHELGTPLTPIRLQVHLLRSQLNPQMPPEMLRGVEILDRNVARLQTLVQDLLNAARLQANSLTLSVKDIDLSQILDEANEIYQEPCREAGITLEVTHLPAIPIQADPVRVSQVLFNLLSNAVKFTPRGGQVHLEARDVAGSALITVSDTGVGMRPDQIERLFRPFSQVHDVAQTTKPGSGLGLFICKSIVELHGGEMWCSSLGPGRGSTFSVRLPLRATSAPPIATVAVLPTVLPGPEDPR
jgi:signal transduction histidine kinase